MKSQTAESGHDQELGHKPDSDSDMQGHTLHHENQVSSLVSSSTTATMDDPAPAPPSSAAAPQIRSRITVVCAECKRLKLKCDRRTPCGSCTKRDTVSRCIYSPAAAEKVDLHSINNRMIQVETMLSMITAGKTPPPFQSSYPLAQVPITSSHSATARSSHVASDTASSISIRMHDLVNIWLAHCQLDVFTPGNQALLKSEALQDGPYVKLEQSPIELLHPCGSFHEDTILIDEGPSACTTNPHTTRRNLPPLHLYYIQNREEPSYLSHDAYTPEDIASQGEPSSSASSGQPFATPSISAYLPPPAVRVRLLTNARLAIPHLSLLVHWTRVTELADPAVAAARADKERQRSFANSVFFGAHTGSRSPSPSPLSPVNSAASLPLFACTCYLLALGALESPDDTSVDHSFLYAFAGQALSVWEEFRSSSPDAKEEEASLDSVDVSVDVSKAKQAEKERDYLDHVVALLLQVKYLLRSGSSKDLSETIFPLIGKLVNTARGLGLARDPESETGVRKNTKAEERRRVIWWDIMFYDMFTSDVLEQTPLITSFSYNTKIPAIACSPLHPSNSRNQSDESADGSEESDLSCERGDDDERPILSAKPNGLSKGPIQSRLIPLPKTKTKTKVTCTTIPDDAETGFFGVRCRVTRLAQNIKYRLAHPGCDCCACGSGYTLDQAAKLEAEIRSWASDLPPSLRLESSTYPEPKTPKHTALAAELAVLANRMIISVYVPLMRPPQEGAASSSTSVYSAAHPWSPASRATVDAAQGVIRAARVLHRLVQVGNEASFMCGFYPLQKAVGDSLVICAHAGFASTKPGRIAVLVEEVSVALEILGVIGAPEGEMSRLLVSMKRRIESGDVCKKGEENALKRKHAALEKLQPVERRVEMNGQTEAVSMALESDSSFVKTNDNLPLTSQQSQNHRPVIPPLPQRQSSVPRSSKAGDRKHPKKSYTSYPAIGYRDRGKDSAPWMMKKANGTKTEGSVSDPRVADFTSSPVQDIQEVHPTQQSSPDQNPISHPIMNQYRSRSPSISLSQASRLQTSEYSQYTEERDVDMHPSQRRKFSINDAGQHQPHQSDQAQQSFNVPSSSQYIPSQPSSRPGSYEPSRAFDQSRRSLDQGSTSSDGTYGGSPSPYANSSSGPLSAASSPYGSTHGHPQTPTTYTPSLHHPSPPAFVQQQTTVSSPQTYYHMGYEAPYEGQAAQQQQALGPNTMDSSMPVQGQVSASNGEGMVASQSSLPHTPIYEKAQQQIMYDVKTPAELVHQQLHHYQVASGRGTPVDHIPMNSSTPQVWATSQYVQPHQSLVEHQDQQYWSTSQSYY